VLGSHCSFEIDVLVRAVVRFLVFRLGVYGDDAEASDPAVSTNAPVSSQVPKDRREN
jgi:hypothetical protein